MRSSITPPTFAQAQALSRGVGYGEGIEWEELPSLSGTLGHRLINPELGPKVQRPIVPSVLGGAWDHTMPVDLDMLPPPSPFRETLQGLSMREVHEPDLFRHFFGDGNHAK